LVGVKDHEDSWYHRGDSGADRLKTDERSLRYERPTTVAKYDSHLQATIAAAAHDRSLL